MTYDQRTIYQALCDRICIPIQLIFVIYNKSASVLEISVTHILPTEGYTFMLSEDNATLQILFWYALIVFWNVAWIQNIHITYTYTYTYITHAYYTYSLLNDLPLSFLSISSEHAWNITLNIIFWCKGYESG